MSATQAIVEEAAALPGTANNLAPAPRQLEEPRQTVEEQSVPPESPPAYNDYQPSSVPVSEDVTQLEPHRTSLPTFLYLCSFTPPLPSLFRNPLKFSAHPIVLYVIGTLSALAAGVGMPALDLLYGFWTNGITPNSADGNAVLNRSELVAWIMTVVGVVTLILNWVFLTCFTTAAHDLSVRLRHTYVASVIVQDQIFFDVVGSGEIASRAGKDISTIRTGLGEKMAYTVWSLSTLFAGIVSSFVNVARLGGVLFSLIPATTIVFAVLGWATGALGGPALIVEGRAASLLEQMLSSVRIVQAFGMAPQLIRRLNEGMLSKLARLGLGRSIVKGMEQGAVFFILNTSYALSFWYGSHLIARGETDVGHVLTAFWNLLNALFAFANVVPHVSGIFEAYTALGLLRKQIERRPVIDIRDQSGLRAVPPANIASAPAFELRDVTFAYPSRPFVRSLDAVSVTIERGQVTAFAGPSGSGKSTIASLFLREYDPETCNLRNPADPLPEDEQKELDEKLRAEKRARHKRYGVLGSLWAREKGEVDEPREKDGKKASTDPVDPEEVAEVAEHEGERTKVRGHGQVFYNGEDLRSYNLRWLRSQIAVVSQHPQLFSASIFENVAAGLTGTELALRPDLDLLPDASPATKARVAKTRSRCQGALEKADAWGFVQRLPEGMDTVVSGGRAGLLSGGQRQRVAIARALVREPEVLILDEATSALDSATEDRIKRMLQDEQQRRGMTVVLIAHRLSTIAQADKIVVLAGGKVLDQGRYNELITDKREDRTFKDMVDAQQAAVVSAKDQEKQQPHKSGHAKGDTESGETATPSATAAVTQQSTDSAAESTQLNRPPGPPRTMTTYTSEDSPVASPHPDRSSVGRIMRKLGGLVKRQKWAFLIGCIGAIIGGGSFPAAAYLTGEAVDSLSIQNDNARLKSESSFWALWFFIIACADLFIFFVGGFFLEHAGEAIVRKLKVDGLRALLRQEIGFFDHEDSSSGALTSAVSSHPANVGAATGLVLAQVIFSVVNLLGSVILGLALSWKAALVCLAPIFVLFVSGFAEVAMLEKYETRASKPAARAAAYVNEAMDTIRTVSALGRESETMRTFDSAARSDTQRHKFLMLGAAGFAVGQAMVLFLSALVMYWGGKLLSQRDISVSALYAVFEAVIIGAFSAGRMFTFVGDYSRAFASFATLESWMSREPKIATMPADEASQETTSTILTANKTATADGDPMAGDVVFNGVEMRYPQRPKHPALRCVNLHIKAGSKVAFCGTSGSGKSSMLALLQRFYDPSRGTITFGGVDSRALSLEQLRAGMAYVSQDPVLFEGTIRFNLCLGSTDPDSVTDEELRSAAERACILDFISSLENGFDTEVGMKGAQLSGGQKQRLCIARALVRNAPLLCLDEATSALDATSEKSVQRALDQASVGRTTVTIAHRLSTIRNADVIHVVEDGGIVESGSHEELLAREGSRYRELVAAQL